MNNSQFSILNSQFSILLFPFSLIYGIITYMRNKLYDWKIFKSIRYDGLIVVSVGNITVGGTGKTPFVEYIIRKTGQNYRTAVLSRGYKRSSKGFVLAHDNSTPRDLGDEPYQIKRKFPELVVAVDTNRLRGIEQIRRLYPDTQVVVLDDAFQYRKIRPDLSILLADYNRPLYRDSMLPGGKLREWKCFAKRADILVITKTPAEINPAEQSDIIFNYSSIFPKKKHFATLSYGEPIELFTTGKSLSTADIRHCDVVMICGIANPKPFEEYIRKNAASTLLMRYPDHHAFSEKDIEKIINTFNSIESSDKKILTTEKDAVRLQQMTIPATIAECCFYIPIEINILNVGD